MTREVWIGCAEGRAREPADDVDVTLVVTFLEVKGVDLTTTEVEELL